MPRLLGKHIWEGKKIRLQKPGYKKARKISPKATFGNMRNLVPLYNPDFSFWLTNGKSACTHRCF